MTKKWDFKNSPAMGHLKKAGKAVSEALGLTDVDEAPAETKSEPRNESFEVGSTEHFKPGVNAGNVTYKVPEEHAERDLHFEQHGLGLGSEGNVTSIRRGIALKGERISRKPEGY